MLINSNNSIQPPYGTLASARFAILNIRLGTGTLPMTLTPTNLYLCANTHAREGGRGAGERLHIHLRLVHLKQAALRQLQQQDSAYI